MKVLLLRFGELYLKGNNRKIFEGILVKNIEEALNGENFIFKKTFGRYVISNYEENNENILVDKLMKVFGLYSLSRAVEVNADIDEIKNEINKINCLNKSFKIFVKRADKSFPICSMELAKLLGEVVLKNNEGSIVDLYNPEKEIIHNFSETALPGQKVAIVGPTGAGKTTLVNLLMRFYEINSGDILIDGISIKDMNRSYVRSLFGMVLQDTWLFEGTIRENLAYGKLDATDEEIIEACKASNVDHFIKTQPNSYNMVLDEEANLSQGQKQLITIARAMVANAPMLILDEATSSVDTRTEELIQEAMDKLIKGRTSFVIAHRLSTIKNADLILVMKDGNVIETGKHEELLAKNGFYADLYNSQFTKKHAEIDELN